MPQSGKDVGLAVLRAKVSMKALVVVAAVALAAAVVVPSSMMTAAWAELLNHFAGELT